MNEPLSETEMLELNDAICGMFSDAIDSLLLNMDDKYSSKFHKKFDERKKEADENRPSQTVIGNCSINFYGNRILLVNNNIAGSQIKVPILLKSGTEAYSVVRVLAEEAIRKSQQDYLNIISGIERFVQ